jgi:hypothetical protein
MFSYLLPLRLVRLSLLFLSYSSQDYNKRRL